MDEPRYLNIPVILGTSRKGRASVHAATLIADLLNRRAGVCSEVIMGRPFRRPVQPITWTASAFGS